MTRHPESLLERLPLVSYMLRAEAPSRALYVSPQIEEIFGIPPCAFEADHTLWTRTMHPDDRATLVDGLAALRAGAPEMAVEYRVRVDGRWVWVRDRATLGDGCINGFLVDITREKELEDQLALERATLDAFFAKSHIGLAITDAEGRYVRINESLAQLNGGSPGEFIGRSLAEMRPDIAAVVDPLREYAGDDGEYQVVVAHPDHPIEALLSFFPFEVHGERYIGRAVVDLTEQRRAQAAEELYRHLIEQLPLVVYVNDVEPKRAARFVSPQIEEVTGYAPEEFLADHSLGDAMIHPDDFAEITALEEAGDVFEHEYRIIRKDGEVRWVLDRMETVRDAHGSALYEQGFLVDITERRETELMLRAVWDGAIDAMVVTDDFGNYIDANPTACRLFGRSHEELTTMHVDELFGPGAFARWRETGAPAREYVLTRPDGEERVLESKAKDNVLPGLHFAALRDVTERRHLQAEAWRAQKLETVARLAGGVAHDFNNLLTAIRGYAQLLRSRADDGSVEHHHATEIDRAADRAAALTGQLLALGRRQTLRVRPLDLNRELEESAGSLVELVGPTTELTFDLEPALVAVRADWPLLAQAVANIVGNAAEAMPDGGQIAVRTRNAEVCGREDLADGTYAVLSVADGGPGIAPTALEHVFEPFFTTKEVGEGGGGLGLASAYGTVKQTGGTITVESEVGVGSTFSIYLPAASAALVGAVLAGDGETILVVERDPAARDVAFELLTDSGYRVLSARTTADAARIADAYDGPIDLLLTDLDVLRERALLDLLRGPRPDLQALSIAKPYTPDRLRSAVRMALDSPKRVTAGHISA
jgi:PAS domain S-box-containing protein